MDRAKTAYGWMENGIPVSEISDTGIFLASAGPVLAGTPTEMTIMKNRIFFYFAVVVLALTIEGLPPSIAGTDKDAVTLDTVIVTARQDEEERFETGDVDMEEFTGFVSVIKRQDFEGKMEDLGEVLQKEAGIQIRQSGGLGSFSTVSMRGSSSEQVLVYMDGVLLNDAAGGGVDLSNIALSDVAAIEVFRGVSPINFGKGSIGGVINIRTLRAREGFKASADAGYGSFNTRKLSGFVNHKTGKWDYLISAGYLGSDNDFEMLNDNGTPQNPADDKWEKRNNAQFNQGNILAKLGYDFTDDTRVAVVNQWFSKDQGLPSWNNSPQTETSLDTERNITTLSLISDDIGPLHFNTRTSVDYSYKYEMYDDSQGHVGLGRQKTRYITNRYGGKFYVESPFSWNTVGFLVDMHHEDYEPEDLLTNRETNKSTRDILTAGLQDTIFLLEDTLTVIPALRYTNIKDDLRSGTDAWGGGVNATSRHDDYVNPQLGVKYNPVDWLVLKTNLAQYVREPSFFELFGDRGFFIGNPDLKAEKGINFDAGFNVGWSKPFSWLERISLNGTYFHTKADDLITFVYDSRGIGRAENISEARIDGVEGGFQVDFLKFFRLTASLTWQDPVNQGQVRAFHGKKLPGRYKTSAAGNLEARYGGVKVYLEYLRETGIYYDSANLLPADDKNVFNAGISWLYRSFLFSLEGKNLTNDRYEDFNGYPMPGRAFSFTVGYRY